MQAPVLSLRHYGASPGSHSHGYFQVLLGLSGTLELEVDGRGQRVASGGGCVIEPGARHDFASPQGSQCLVLDSADPGWARCIALAPWTSHTLPLARYLATALQQGSGLAREHGPALLLEAWLAGTTAPRPSPERGRPIDWNALRTWAAAHWHRPLEVADLAAQAHLSPAQFADRCRAEQGHPPMVWLRTLRLAQARWMRSQGMPVTEVAQRTGYRSPSALTAALRRSKPALRDDGAAPRDGVGP